MGIPRTAELWLECSGETSQKAMMTKKNRPSQSNSEAVACSLDAKWEKNTAICILKKRTHADDIKNSIIIKKKGLERALHKRGFPSGQ